MSDELISSVTSQSLACRTPSRLAIRSFGRRTETAMARDTNTLPAPCKISSRPTSEAAALPQRQPKMPRPSSSQDDHLPGSIITPHVGTDWLCCDLRLRGAGPYNVH